MILKTLLSVLVPVVALQALATNTWYVSASAAAGGDGSEALPFQTIQTAIAAASADDVVRVKPGVYDQGETDDGYMMSRVVLDKRLTLESTGGRDKTFIVGRKSSASDGYGTDAVRCVFAGGYGATIRGFTICNGGVATTDDSPKGSGGGVSGAGSTKSDAWIVDCVISNCVAVRGGAVRGATVFRSLIAGNSRVGLGNGAAGRDAAFYNCVITGNKPLNQPLLHNCDVVNCTVFGNATGNLWEGAYVRNSLFFKNIGTKAGSVSDARNNVIDFTETDFSPRDDGKGHAVADNQVNVSPYQVLSPFFEDLRPLSDTAASTNASAALMKIYGSDVPETYLYTDYLGAAIPKTGTICAGAVQTTAPAPAYGGVAFNGDSSFAVFGAPVCAGGLWAYPTSYPAQLHVTAKNISARHVFAYWVSSNTQANWRAPEMDDSFYVLPPESAGEFVTVGILAATDAWVRYVDPVKGDDDGNSGTTADAPYKTLQKAADSLTGSYVNSVVYCAAGDYDDTTQSSTSYNGNERRLVKADAKYYVRFKGAGKGRSVIWGRADSVTGECGETDTCGGVCLGKSCVLQGFTIRNCFGRTTGGDLGYGGAGFVGAVETQVADCRFEACLGNKGGVAYYGSYSRCEFVCNTGLVSCVRGTAWLVNCLFVGNHEGGQGVLADLTTGAFNCTMVGDGSRSYGGGMALYNSILTRHMESSSGGKLSDCLVWNTGYFVTASGFTRVDPQYVSDADPRVTATSPAFTLGGSVLERNTLYCTGDLQGRPMNLRAGGVPTVGCYQYPVSTLTVAEPVSGTVAPSGTVAVDAGASVTLAYTADATRPRQQIGYVIDGVFVPSTDGKTVYTAPAIGEAAAASSATVAFETNWYVNAHATDNSGNGFTPATAKKTLRAALEDCAILAGDTVHAARGNYNEEFMPTPGGTFTTSNRVCVASGVTLVADEGPSVTTITGQASPAPHGGDGYGRGPCAARCAYLASGARLIGFTVTGGRTDISQTGDNLYSSGGGLYCANDTEDKVAVVENCTIKNNYGYRGGGSYAGKFVNCRFSGNLGYGAQGEDSRIAYHYGCIFEANATKRNVYAANCIEQCTFGVNTSIYGTAKTLKGCLFLTQTINDGNVLDHCAYVAGGAIDTAIAAGKLTANSCAPVTAQADFLLDANFIPLKGSPLVDKGPTSAVSASFGGCDNRQSQRVYNGRIDIGANEYDWRGDFGALLGVTVDAASPDVTAQTAALRVPTDATLRIAWQPPVGKKARFDAEVTGAGSLAIAHNDTALAALTAADGRKTVKFRAEAENVIDFAFSSDNGYADIGNFVMSPGLLLFVR